MILYYAGGQMVIYFIEGNNGGRSKHQEEQIWSRVGQSREYLGLRYRYGTRLI